MTLRTLACVIAFSSLLAIFVAASIAPVDCHDRTGNFMQLSHASMNSLHSVFAVYRLHVGSYPTSLDDLLKPLLGEQETNWQGPYVESAARLQDAWGHRLQYKAPGIHNPQHYDLWSMGKDGEDGTDDDICNWASDDP